ncbi:unnamed protein product [Rotaria sp. Silwood1]|nr:unnamed protein product [Rotaria sp. Silwood1]CAF3700705.1 unnamed protein product [Rotaria sp. Silwood1]CAF4949153.1 unnamed protein product [Rotaria sp. Silwood1]
MNAKKIQSDYDMSIVMAMLKKKQTISSSPFEEAQSSEIYSMILEYHMQAYETDIHCLSLDGGGIRGYMPIQVLCQLIIEQHLDDIKEFDSDNSQHRERFKQAQLDFIKQFDYIVGTSTGGLIGFCLTINYDIFNIKKIYANSSHYFKKNRFGPYLWAKYDPVHIHNQIDEIIGTITLKNGKQLTAKDATLLDIHNFLNPDDMITSDMMTDDKLAETLLSHGNWLEFVDESSMRDLDKIDQDKIRHRVKREKVLLITAYNTTTDTITIFNTSYAKHWPYLIADVLKATMAAPTYFPPHEMCKRTIKNGHFIQDKNDNNILPEIFIDGGVFANDPELAALWAIRMQWKKLANYYLLSIGTGCYNAKLSPSSWGGIVGWILNDGLLVNTLMDATRSLTEIITNNLAKFNNIKRMKFNYKIAQSMSLDDPSFVTKFDDDWKNLQKGDDYQALVYFYKKYMNKTQT